ncbi:MULTISPECIES: alpha/beta hydrolase [unclassified Curtobacterium]|uniref:alpha/beta hydrolase n=1 Tax=unclassified Curtobacterium TaxID=257496 RepID=UPI001AE47B03|nr:MULTISPECIES: alpha/beta hydrolase [unclassified Curtobacterium]MBP1300392.1 uncharacterized protein YukE [Curtobacterium sp. 1310]MCM3521626.1 alpha/beta hydrolase family protein [Curtobacterium sp. P97]MDT0209398.1 alpha/beta hydrolase [Curtobacterium sp. BRD11]
MGDIQYDEAAANAVVRAASAAADRLRGQGAARRSAAESALDDFRGAYAKRFEESVQIEADDRPKLTSALDDLVEQVTEATAAAEQERQRREQLAAWQLRQDERDRQVAADPLGLRGSPSLGVFDFKPSETPIAAPTITVAFSARGRTRTGGGTAEGTSSAVPGSLRSFASDSRAADRAAEEKLTTLRTAWHGFTGSCGWVRIASASFLAGADRLLDENREDAAWLERIADAFDRAGGSGELSNATLDIAAPADLPPALQQMLDPDLTASEVAALWAQLGWSSSRRQDVRALPLPVLARLGNLEGVAYWARDTANRTVLDARITEAEQEVEALQSTIAYDNGTAWGRASENLEALRAIETASRPSDETKGRRFVMALTDDRPPLAAVSIGDLDTAQNVTWAVPGMGTTAKDMVGWTEGAQHLYDAQEGLGPADRAVIGWIGYETPPQPVISGKLDFGVLGSDYAKPGGDNLAASIKGLDAVRAGDMPTTNVVAHSYGTTASAYGLTQEGIHVDTFTSIGSAGLPNSVDNADDLNAGHVYAAQARDVWLIDPEKGDQWAWTGRLSAEHGQDPTDPDFDATVFGADGTEGLNPVEDHGTLTESKRGYLDQNTESLQNIAFATTGHPEDLTKRKDLGPTQFQQSLLENPQWTL